MSPFLSSSLLVCAFVLASSSTSSEGLAGSDSRTYPAQDSSTALMWQLATGTSGNWICAIDIFQDNPDSLFAIGSKSLIVSTNRGESWDSVSPIRTDHGALRIDRSDPRRVFLSHMGLDPESNDISMSTNGGYTWNTLFIGRRFVVALVEIDPSDPATVYAGVGPAFLKRSTNHGVSWESVNTPTISALRALAISASNDSVLYLSSANQLFKSTNKGSSWSLLPFGFEFSAGAMLAIDPRDGNTLYAGVYSAGFEPGGMYKSTAGGESWVEMNSGLSSSEWKIWSVVVDAKNPSTLYLGIQGDTHILFRSTDGATTWLPFDSGMDGGGTIKAITVDTLNGRVYSGRSWIGAGLYYLDLSTNAVTPNNEIASSVRLYQNFPNPFNPSTKFKFTIVNHKLTTLKVYDVLAREVATLVNEVKEPGTYEATWDASGMASGVYVYRLTSGGLVQTRKMLLLK